MLQKAAPTLARASAGTATAGQVFVNAGLVGLAGQTISNYVRQRNQGQQETVNQVATQPTSQQVAQVIEQVAQPEIQRQQRPAIEEEIKEGYVPPEIGTIQQQQPEPTTLTFLRRPMQEGQQEGPGFSVRQDVMEYIQNVNQLYDIDRRDGPLGTRVNEIAPPVRSLALQIIRLILPKNSEIYNRDNKEVFERLVQMIVNQIILSPTEPLQNLTIGRIREIIKKSLETQKLPDNENDIQIWTDLHGIISKRHSNLTRTAVPILFGGEQLRNPNLSAEYRLFANASNLQILRLRTANFLISEHLDQFRQAFVRFMTDDLQRVFTSETDRDLPFVVFSWGLGLAMAGDDESGRILLDMLSDDLGDLQQRFDRHMASNGYYYENERGVVDPSQGLILDESQIVPTGNIGQGQRSNIFNQIEEYRIERIDNLEIQSAFLPNHNQPVVEEEVVLSPETQGGSPPVQRSQINLMPDISQRRSGRSPPTIEKNPLQFPPELLKQVKKSRRKQRRTISTQTEINAQNSVQDALLDHLGQIMSRMGYDGRQGSVDRNFIQQALVPVQNEQDLSLIDRSIIAFKRYLIQRGLRDRLGSLVALGRVVHQIGRFLAQIQGYLNYVNPMVARIIGSIVPSMQRAGEVLQNERQNESLIQQTQEEEIKEEIKEGEFQEVEIREDRTQNRAGSRDQIYVAMSGLLAYFGTRQQRRLSIEEESKGNQGEYFMLDDEGSGYVEDLAARRRAAIKKSRLKMLAAGVVVGGGGAGAIGNERLAKLYYYLTGKKPPVGSGGVIGKDNQDGGGDLSIKEPEKKVFDPATFILRKELELRQRDIDDTSVPDIVREKGRMAEEQKKKGRPKGSKNKPKNIDPNAPLMPPKKRGRPRKPEFLSNDVEVETNAAIQN